MTMRRLATLFVSLLISAPAVAGTRYGSDRFDTWIEVPTGYVAQREPANGDGRTLLSRDGKVRILVYGRWDITKEGLSPPAGVKVTYKSKGPRWAVYSGTQGGKIVYAKMISACKDNDLIHNVVIEYPAAMKARMATEVADVARSLKGGCSFN